MARLEEFRYAEDCVNDFYEEFEASLEDDEISVKEEGFMVGFVEGEEEEDQ